MSCKNPEARSIERDRVAAHFARGTLDVRLHLRSELAIADPGERDETEISYVAEPS